MEKIEDIANLERGDKVLFDGRSKPLIVEEVKEEAVIIRGPNGGRYQLFDEEDAKHFLISKPGDREYASYAKDIRKIGEWKEKQEDKFVHSDTEASAELVKSDAGFWTVKVEGLNHDLDLPKYGYSSKKAAREELEKMVEKNPEG